MGTAKGIDENKFFKLGKAPAKHDRKNLKFGSILKAKLPAPPDEYDFDLAHPPGVPTPMFGNDRYGDCVIAGRAHQTLRFELIEQGGVLKISDKDVIDEYLRESGGVDEGLVVLESLKEWRKDGWLAAGGRYYINAFAELDRSNRTELKQAVFADMGIGIGLQLPKSAQNEINAGKPWETTTGAGSQPDSWGGHYVYVSGYTALGPTCVTWGRKQRMSWAFFDKYCDEAYAIIDAANPKTAEVLNERELNKFLKSVTPVLHEKSGRNAAMLEPATLPRLGAKKKAMAAAYDIAVSLTGPVKLVRLFMMEDKDVTNSMRYDGKAWTAEFKSFALGTDNDLDIYLHAWGPAQNECKLTVTFAGKKPVESTKVFDKNSSCSFSPTIVPGELKDA